MVGPRPTGRGRRRGRRAAAARGAAGRHRAGQGLQLRAAVAGRGHLGRRVGSGGDVVRNVLVAALASLMVSLLGTPFAIRLFRARGYGQLIRDDGPTTHLTKRGTPTMGGTVIILPPFLVNPVGLSRSCRAAPPPALPSLFRWLGPARVGSSDA